MFSCTMHFSKTHFSKFRVGVLSRKNNGKSNLSESAVKITHRHQWKNFATLKKINIVQASKKHLLSLSLGAADQIIITRR